MLHGDAAPQGLDAIQVALRDRLGVVEEPAKSIKRHFAIDRLKHVQEAGDGLVVSGVQAERPPVLNQEPNHWGQLLL